MGTEWWRICDWYDFLRRSARLVCRCFIQITISTVGLVPEMRAVLARTRVQVALSLHATTGRQLGRVTRGRPGDSLTVLCPRSTSARGLCGINPTAART